MTPVLEAAYAEPHRRYHTRAHIEDCLGKLAAVQGLSARERRLLEWAIWWHDAIYDPRRADNEERSAEMADRDLRGLGVNAEDRGEIDRLIRLTKGHEVPPGDRMGALLVSIDLSILAAEPAHYDAYAKAVREEYAHVPEPAFRAGRAAVLRRFLQAPVLFPDPALASRWDNPARENLARELAALQKF
jgi:predicted metal-dependent HD superfamily phosphohydrolase